MLHWLTNELRPEWPRQPAGVLVESHGARRMHLRDENDLTQVQREVLDDVINGVEH